MVAQVDFREILCSLILVFEFLLFVKYEDALYLEPNLRDMRSDRFIPLHTMRDSILLHLPKTVTNVTYTANNNLVLFNRRLCARDCLREMSNFQNDALNGASATKVNK